MTAKEKAKELLDKIYEKIASYPEKSLCYFEWNEAKQCALIAVDEIIDSLQIKNYPQADQYEYWNEVKHEINKL